MRAGALLALTLAACHGAVTATTARLHEGALHLGDHALVDGDARFYVDASGDAAHVHAGLGAGPSLASERLIAVRVVGEQGDFVEVENLAAGEDSRDCSPSLAPIATLRLHLWVRRDDLVPALTRELGVTFRDGTGVRLAPGVAASPTARAGRFAFAPDGQPIEIAAPAAAVGLTYPAGRFVSVARADSLCEPIPAWIGGASFLLPAGPVLVENGTDGAARVTLQTACAIYRARVASPPAPCADGSIGLGSLTGAVVPVRAGARITWPDGRPAGVAVAETLLVEEPRLAGDRMCTDLVLGDPASSLTVCFAVKDVTVETGF